MHNKPVEYLPEVIYKIRIPRKWVVRSENSVRCRQRETLLKPGPQAYTGWAFAGHGIKLFGNIAHYGGEDLIQRGHASFHHPMLNGLCISPKGTTLPRVPQHLGQIIALEAEQSSQCCCKEMRIAVNYPLPAVYLRNEGRRVDDVDFLRREEHGEYW